MSKNTWLALLVTLNLVLVAGLVLTATSPKAALAQGTGLAGDYLVVAGEVQDSHDAVYMIDMRSRILHVLYYDRGTKRLKYGQARDLERDFRNNRG